MTKWYKFKDEKPANDPNFQVIIKLGENYLLISGEEVNKRFIKDANLSEEDIQQLIMRNNMLMFMGEMSGAKYEEGKLKAEKEIRKVIRQKKEAVDILEWCSFSEVLKKLLS